jgi:hypothetical protein
MCNSQKSGCCLNKETTIFLIFFWFQDVHFLKEKKKNIDIVAW